MIAPAQAVRVVIATRPIDFRRGHDSLAAYAQNALKLDPHSGVIMVFRSKRGDRIKVLVWDGSGLVLTYKRLEEGKFAWPAIRDGVMRLSRAQFEALFDGLDWRRVNGPRRGGWRWRPTLRRWPSTTVGSSIWSRSSGRSSTASAPRS